MAPLVILVRIISCFLVLLPLRSLGFICPGPITPPQGFSYAGIESNISGRASEDYAKLRIKLIFHESINDKPYKELVQVAANFWSNVLSVKPVHGKLFMRRDCELINMRVYKALDGSDKKEWLCLGSCNRFTYCGEIEVPKEHLDVCKYCTQDGQKCTKDPRDPGTGVDNADIVIYVAALNTRTCSNGTAVAHAGACDLEPDLDRPVFASVNICPTLGASGSKNEKAILQIIKHEMMHALAFDPYLFPYFRDKHGEYYLPRGEDGLPMNGPNVKQTVINTTVREWHVRGDVIKLNRVFLVTPKVKEEAQNHFGCSELEGAELEDFGNAGSQYSHFEARLFYDDAMRADTTGKLLFSRLDFALLEDSGWYKVDYSLAEDMEFGRGLGCNFCMKSCKFWMDKKRKEGRSLDPYCDSPDLGFKRGLACIGKKLLFTGCPLAKIDPGTIQRLHEPNSREPSYQLPRKYQHFDKILHVKDHEVPQWGSFNQFEEFCPVPLQNFDGDIKCGIEPNQPWNPNPGNPNPGIPMPGNPNPGNPIPGNPNPGIPIPGNPNPWNPYPWIPNPWNPYPWIPIPGNPYPWNPYPFNPYPFNPYPWNPNPWKPNPTTSTNPTASPNPTSKPFEPTPTSTSNPAEEAKDDEDDTNECSHLGSSFLLVFLLLSMVIVL